MRSIQQLIQQINTKDDPIRKREYDALKQLDDNILELENRIDNIEKLNMMYHVECTRSIAKTYLTGTAIDWDRERYQFGNMHSINTDNTIVRVRRNGVYVLTAGLDLGVSAGGTVRQLLIQRNTVNVAADIIGNHGAIAQRLNAAISLYCYEGDALRVVIVHDVGVALNVNIALTFFTVTERMEDLHPPQYGLLNPDANTFSP